MINAKEIRLGNYLKKGEEYVEVVGIESESIQSISFPHIKNLNFSSDYYDPIPITQKIFAGLPVHPYSTDHFEVVSNSRTFIFQRYNSLCWNILQKEFNFREDFALVKICFLHQFQNLVFLLTNEELKIVKENLA